MHRGTTSTEIRHKAGELPPHNHVRYYEWDSVRVGGYCIDHVYYHLTLSLSAGHAPPAPPDMIESGLEANELGIVATTTAVVTESSNTGAVTFVKNEKQYPSAYERAIARRLEPEDARQCLDMEGEVADYKGASEYVLRHRSLF